MCGKINHNWLIKKQGRQIKIDVIIELVRRELDGLECGGFWNFIFNLVYFLGGGGVHKLFVENATNVSRTFLNFLRRFRPNEVVPQAMANPGPNRISDYNFSITFQWDHVIHVFCFCFMTKRTKALNKNSEWSFHWPIDSLPLMFNKQNNLIFSTSIGFLTHQTF